MARPKAAPMGAIVEAAQRNARRRLRRMRAAQLRAEETNRSRLAHAVREAREVGLTMQECASEMGMSVASVGRLLELAEEASR